MNFDCYGRFGQDKMPTPHWEDIEQSMANRLLPQVGFSPVIRISLNFGAKIDQSAMVRTDPFRSQRRPPLGWEGDTAATVSGSEKGCIPWNCMRRCAGPSLSKE